MPDVEPILKAPKFKGSRQARARARLERRYLVWEREQLRLRPWCEMGSVLEALGHPHLCRGHAAMLHHRRLTGQGGAWMLPANTRATCQPCHDFVHHHVTVARLAGLIVATGDDGHDELGAAA